MRVLCIRVSLEEDRKSLGFPDHQVLGQYLGINMYLALAREPQSPLRSLSLLSEADSWSRSTFVCTCMQVVAEYGTGYTVGTISSCLGSQNTMKLET